jgi:FMNH2-dependent dimethyl sulfone monooxygenase
MQFGIYAPIPMATVGSVRVAQAIDEALKPLPAGCRDVQADLSTELLLAADTVGFDLTLFAERHLGQDLSAWVLASAIGSRFEHMRSLVAVHPGLWDPVMVAKLAVSLDRICKGRMAINIVNGWFDEEFRMFGGTVLAGEERYRRTTEFMDIIRGLWANETFSYDGQYYKLENGRLLLKPATTTPPEMFSVSSGDRGRTFIAEQCDWWFINYPKEAQSPDEVLRSLEASVADMEQRARRAGRKVRYALNPFLALGPTEERAVADTVKKILESESDPDPRKIERRMLPNTKAGLMGPSDKVRRQIRRYEDMGLELLLLKMIPEVANIRHIAEEVIAPYRSPTPQMKAAS